MNRPIRWVAGFEAFKGVLVLVAASGLLSLMHKDVVALATHLIEHTHLNPASKIPQVFLEAARHLQDTRLVLLALGAAAYAAVRLVEAYGLYNGRVWAELLAAGSGAIYLPFELAALARHPTALHAGLLLANATVVGVMVRALLQRRTGAPPDASRSPSASGAGSGPTP
jgi:uncharacterized membrane protein (DUF2068 family)